MRLVNVREAVHSDLHHDFQDSSILLSCFLSPVRCRRQRCFSSAVGNLSTYLHGSLGGVTSTRPWPVLSVPRSSPSRPVSAEIGEIWGSCSVARAPPAGVFSSRAPASFET